MSNIPNNKSSNTNNNNVDSMPATENAEAPRTPRRLLERRSDYDMFNDSPGSYQIDDEAICSTPPQAAYRLSSGSSLNHTPELDFGRQSPVFMSMTQRAMKLGVDVVWASSPTRLSSSPLIDRKMHTPPISLFASSPTGIVRRRSIKERKSLHRPPSPKKGLYKFQEDLKSIMPLLRKDPATTNGDPESGLGSFESGILNSSISGNDFDTGLPENLSSFSTQNSPIRLSNHKRSGSEPQTPGTSAKVAKCDDQKESNKSILSTSIQNAFMDDSEFDMLLFESSQEVESRIKNDKQNSSGNQARPTPKPIHLAKPHLFVDSFPDNDSIDEFMSSKELDQLISSQTSIVRDAPPNPKTPMERHKSMPVCTSLLNISDDIISELSDDKLNDLIANSSAGNTSATRGAQWERHNSMPVSPYTKRSRDTSLTTKRRLLKSFPKADQIIICSDDSDS